jgi:predicted dehydrogenase
MSERTVRIGFVGAGGIAQAHIRSLQELPQAEVVAVCDIDEERAKAVAAPLSAAVYTEGEKLIAQTALDALYVCVPPHAHGDLEILAARKGLHLFVEKPVNLYLGRGVKAWEAIRASGVMTQTGYVMRYWPGSIQLKEFLADKAVGTAHATRWGGLPGAPWWRRYDQSGGQLVEMTTHQVDLLRWVMGEVEAVSAGYSFDRLLRGEPGVTVPDSQTALLRFASGASATISTSCALGQTGLGSLDFVVRNAKVSWTAEAITVEPEGLYAVPPPPVNPMGIDQAFVLAIAGGNPALLRSPYDDALRSAAVTLAANLSAENGGRLVRMDELPGPQA